MIAKIYYAKIISPYLKEKWFVDVYRNAHFGDGLIVLSHNNFRRYWVLMDITDASGVDDLERLFAKYNDEGDGANPLATSKGQERVRKSGTHHTSMSVLDIIKLGDKYFMVAGSGFKKVSMR